MMGSPRNKLLPLLLHHEGRRYLPLLLTIYCTLGQVAAKRECFADLNGPKDDPNNIYKCESSEQCCQEGGNPSCCREKDPSVATEEQLTLWGTLAVLILILALVVWYCRHDGDCCGNKKGQESSSCGCCSKKNKEKEEIIEVETGDNLYDPHKTRDDETPDAAVYNPPDESKHPPPNSDEIPAAYRDIDYEVAP